MNETVDLRFVNNAILWSFRKEPILVHLIVFVFVVGEFSRL